VIWLALFLFLTTPALADPVICEVDNLAVKDITDRSASVTFRHDTGTKVDVRIMKAPLMWAEAVSLSCTGCPCVATSLTPNTNYEVGAVASLLDGSESGPMSGPVMFTTKPELSVGERFDLLESDVSAIKAAIDKLCAAVGGCQ
jgi:hypothetical protein